MAMDVEEPNPCPELQRVRNGQSWTFLHSFVEMDSILAHDVIHDQGKGHAFHVVGKGLAKTVVHVNLPVHGHQDDPIMQCCMIGTNLSPFWKSTTEVGTKNPWQQAVAPMPVTSRCGRLEFASSMALYVLQVLGYEGVSWEPWRMRKLVATSLLSFPLCICVLYKSGLAINAIPAERGASFCPDLHFICSAEKFPSIMNVRISCLL